MKMLRQCWMPNVLSQPLVMTILPATFFVFGTAYLQFIQYRGRDSVLVGFEYGLSDYRLPCSVCVSE